MRHPERSVPIRQLPSDLQQTLRDRYAAVNDHLSNVRLHSVPVTNLRFDMQMARRQPGDGRQRSRDLLAMTLAMVAFITQQRDIARQLSREHPDQILVPPEVPRILAKETRVVAGGA